MAALSMPERRVTQCLKLISGVDASELSATRSNTPSVTRARK